MAEKIIDGWYYPDIPEAIREESARLGKKRYQRELSSYVDQGDYEGAEKAALRYGDFDAAKSYGDYDERADTRAYAEEVNPFIAKSDYKGALDVAVRSKRPTTEVAGLAEALKNLDAEKLEKAREANARLGLDLQAIEGLPANQRQAAYAAKRAEYASSGTDVSGVPEVWTPGLSRKLINEALSVEKAIDLEFRNRQQNETERHNRVGEAISWTNASTAAANASAKPKKAYTEVQSKAGEFAYRMAGVSPKLSEVEARDDFDPSMVTHPAAAAFSQTAKEYRNYMREWIAGLLRKDTGAAVTDSEFNLYGSTYFPVPGDTDAQVVAKRNARERAFKGVRAASQGFYDEIVAEAGDPSEIDTSGAAGDDFIRDPVTGKLVRSGGR